jgi:hypothetical protein
LGRRGGSTLCLSRELGAYRAYPVFICGACEVVHPIGPHL